MDKVQCHREICEDLNAMFARKNHDYGDSFGELFAECGMVYAYGHLKEKLNRLKSLALDGKKQAVDESVDDTLMDLANYAIMTSIEMKRTEQEGSTCVSG